MECAWAVQVLSWWLRGFRYTILGRSRRMIAPYNHTPHWGLAHASTQKYGVGEVVICQTWQLGRRDGAISHTPMSDQGNLCTAALCECLPYPCPNFESAPHQKIPPPSRACHSARLVTRDKENGEGASHLNPDLSIRFPSHVPAVTRRRSYPNRTRLPAKGACVLPRRARLRSTDSEDNTVSRKYCRYVSYRDKRAPFRCRK